MMEIMNNYLCSKRREMLSEKTITNYKEILTPFCEEVEIDKCTSKEINAYLDALLKRPISQATYATYVRTIKIFLTWYARENEVKYNVSKIRVPKTPKKQVYIYTDVDICYIFAHVDSKEPWIALRNKAIIATMLDSGLRRRETTLLRKSDIHYADHYMIATGKGNKERVVPLGDAEYSYIKAYMDACPYMSDWLFVDRYGNQLTNNAVKQFMQKLKPLMPFEFSAHKLRHNFATNYCLDQYEKIGQVDIYKLMHLLGHENIETTRRYLHYAYDIISAQDNISHMDKIFL